MKRVISIVLGICCSVGAVAQVSLRACQQLARANYPLIKQYDLVKSATSYSISNAKRSYLPQVSLSGQATYQSDVMAFPKELEAMFSQMGVAMEGLNKDQYRVSLDVNQTIWDGGQSKAQQKLLKAEGKVSAQKIAVELYSIQERVNALYFGVLLLDEQLAQNNLLLDLLASNLARVTALLQNGVAMQSDKDAISVEILYAKQQRIQIESKAIAYRQMLAIFTNKKSLTDDQLIKPSIALPTSHAVNRPELQLFDIQSVTLEAQKKLINTATRPRFGAFAQGFYGNPGLDLFNDMVYNEWTWNYMVGVKMQWNISGYYTKKNRIRKLSIAQQQLHTQRETFLFNTSLKTSQEQAAITQIQRVMTDDDKIIALRTAIRKQTEARLQNGVVDINALLREITTESIAKITKSTHEIELLKTIYDLKNTTNN